MAIRFTRPLALGLALVLGFALVAPTVLAQDNVILTDEIDAFVDDRMDQSSIPGVALTIVQDGQVLHSRGFGHASDGQAVTPQTPFIIGSTTKSITALAVMQLVDAGMVDLDAPVQRYIPTFTLADSEASGGITVRHLLTMSSGIPADAGGEAFRSTTAMTPIEAVRSLRTASLAFDPGSAFEYVNANYVILGLLIETVSGQSYGDYLQQHIFAPLEMHHSYTDPALARQDGFADGYRYWFGRPVAYKMPYLEAMVPAGYVISTSEDLSHYLMMYLNNGVYNGTAIISPEGLAELQQPVFEYPLGDWARGTTSHYAMGWLVGGPWGDEPTVFHPGAAPSFTATLHLKADQRLAVVTLTNASHFMPLPGAQDALRQIPRGVMDLLVGQQPAEATGLNRFYLFFNAVVVVTVAVQSVALVRLIRRRLRPSNSGRAWGITRQVIPLTWELGLGALLLIAPSLISSWPHIRVWTPDLAVVAVVVGGLWLVTGLVRIATLVTPVVVRQRQTGILGSGEKGVAVQ